MRLFGTINSQIDRKDRAGWLTVPFDLCLRAIDALRTFFPLETREFSVVAETREFDVVAETREFTA